MHKTPHIERHYHLLGLRCNYTIIVQQRPGPLEGRAPLFEKHVTTEGGVTHSNSSLMEVRILGDVADADL